MKEEKNYTSFSIIYEDLQFKILIQIFTFFYINPTGNDHKINFIQVFN